MNITNVLHQARSTGCCDDLYNRGVASVNWIHGSAKTVAGSFSDKMKGAWASVSEFASRIFAKLGAFFGAAKTTVVDGLSKSYAAYATLPREAKIVGWLSLAATAVATALICNCMNKPAAPAPIGVALATPGAPGAPAVGAAVVAPGGAAPAVGVAAGAPGAPAVGAAVAAPGGAAPAAPAVGAAAAAPGGAVPAAPPAP